MEKKIELCKVKVKDVKEDFGNPRKCSKKKLEELVESIKKLGDFGIFLIDEHNNIIGGNQRLKAVKQLYGEDVEIDCKRLIGFSKAELRAINIKDNTHAGEWDLEALADWTADLNIEMGLELQSTKKTEERAIKEMELIRYEKYDYVMIVCRDELSYNTLIRKLGIEDAKTLIGPKKRKIKARAIWYDDIKCVIEKKDTADTDGTEEGGAEDGI